VEVSFTTVIDKQGCGANKKRCGNAPKNMHFETVSDSF